MIVILVWLIIKRDSEVIMFSSCVFVCLCVCLSVYVCHDVCSDDLTVKDWCHPNDIWKVHNRPISQIQQCTNSISHNAPFRTEMCTFLFWMVHCGIWNRCILGYVKSSCASPTHDVIDDISRSQSTSHFEITISPSIFQLERGSKAQNIGNVQCYLAGIFNFRYYLH